MKTRKILFRADSSSTIGTGHIMRDLVLAQQFKDAEIIFATQELPGNINQKIIDKGYELHILNSNTLDELSTLIKELKIDMIVIDHYGIDLAFEKALKAQYPDLILMVLDDTYEKHYCDILLNHNIYADTNRYSNLVPAHCELRCGQEYTLLREEFIKEKQTNKDNNSSSNTTNVFVAMGGADHANLNIKISEVLNKFDNIHINIVTTTANQHLDELKKYVETATNISLHINSDQIAKIMNNSDFAIVTPSVTLNEIVYMNVPFISIRTASNQDEMYSYLLDKDYVILSQFDADILQSKLTDVIQKMTPTLTNFIDLPLEQKKMILEWRNHETVRQWMFTQQPITLDEHLNYIDTLGHRDDRCYFLVQKGSNAIGIIDFSDIKMKDQAHIGLYANPLLKGVGKLLMESIIHYATKVLKVKVLISEVFAENIPAIRLYQRCGFKAITSKKDKNREIIHMEFYIENR
jgi:UDP-2,4-diacetamido-2,4,6-trideoxy-beta-L-altropyranose hydrolase/UDP-4-amino-4,6-dideoxy-N-acetyl-beta-L-altrosamine N-acetyltransferase